MEEILAQVLKIEQQQQQQIVEKERTREDEQVFLSHVVRTKCTATATIPFYLLWHIYFIMLQVAVVKNISILLLINALALKFR